MNESMKINKTRVTFIWRPGEKCLKFSALALTCVLFRGGKGLDGGRGFICGEKEEDGYLTGI